MTRAEMKKAIIKKRIELCDKRSHNEISADLELANWTARFKDDNWMEQQKIQKIEKGES